MNEIDKKLEKLEEKISGISEIVGETYGVKDITYFETNKYKGIALIKSNTDYNGSGGTAWFQNDEVYYQKRDSLDDELILDRIKKITGQSVNTRHRYNPDLDRCELWGVIPQVEVIKEPNIIKVDWVKDGRSNLSNNYEL